MKRLKFILAALLFILGSTMIIQSTDPVLNDHEKEITACEVIDNLPVEELNTDEKTALLLMIEEEKLARDVYIFLSEKYDSRVFKNISEAENRHMEAISCLFRKYNLENPTDKLEVGKFSNRKFQDMYDDLVIRGNTNLTEALKIGAAIEDLDIYDLNELIESRTTDNADLQAVFKELVRGSRNHMRAFTKNLRKQDASYEVEHISQKLYDSIVAAEQERGGWLCGDEKPRDTREKAHKGENGKCNKKCAGDHSGGHKCSGKGQHGKH